MSIFSRTKRVTYPLDEDAKARIFQHCCILDQDQSPPLCDLVHGFLEDGPQDQLQPYYDSDLDLSENSSTLASGEASEEIVRMTTSFSDPDPYRNILQAHVLRALEAYSGFEKSVLREKVASFLRELGHDAAVCVSKWNSSGKLIAGSYSFIDIVHKTTDVRYLVDLRFASEFEIARPTPQYARVLELVPQVFVGNEENLRTMVRELCDAARLSLKTRGLSLPPWRRSSYLHHKWFGPYKRRDVGSNFGVSPSNKDVVNCRSMGFDNAVNTRLFIRT